MKYKNITLYFYIWLEIWLYLFKGGKGGFGTTFLKGGFGSTFFKG
jgi:hypothetical protein